MPFRIAHCWLMLVVLATPNLAVSQPPGSLPTEPVSDSVTGQASDSLADSAAGPSVEAAGDSVHIFIRSDPDSCFIYLNNADAGLQTPAMIVAPPGEHLIELVLEGYEPLAKRFTVPSSQRATLEFVLQSLPPPRVVADSLGLKMKPIVKKLDVKQAERVRQKWSSLAETFAIVPLGQGVLARLVLPKDQRSAADAMILAGVGLTAISYFVGKTLGKRKLEAIKRRNEQLPEENALIRQHNIDVEQAVDRANEALINSWLERSKDRGIVNVTIE